MNSEIIKELLKNPSAEYRSSPFWAWNGVLDEKILEEQIKAFKAMGFGGFHMHSRTGLATEYLGPDFLNAVRFCTGQAKKHDMLAYLYDEDRYASGYGGGKVTENPEFAARFLIARESFLEPSANESEAVQCHLPYLVGRYDILFNDDYKMISYKRLEGDEKAACTEIFIYSVPMPMGEWFNGTSYVDTLNPAATDVFINKVYKEYKKAVGDEFGRTIPAIFTDEPNVAHLGWFDCYGNDDYSMFWTRNFPEEYEMLYGEELISVLPQVFYNSVNDDDFQVRYRFLDMAAERFARSFNDKIGKWCENNNIALTGHFHSEPTLNGQCSTSIDLMRQYRSYHIPGIDMLFSEVELTTAKQAQSIAHQYGRKQIMTELYGGSRWDCDFRSYKAQTDWQTACGFNLRVPHLSFYSMNGESKRDFPASIGYQSPWYKEFKVLEDHFARTAAAMSQGKPMVKIGVIHPIESYWMEIGPDSTARHGRKRIENAFLGITEWLISNHLDFDFISEALVPDLWDGKNLGQMRYEAIVVPTCRTLRLSTLKMLLEFKKTGGAVIFAGSCPGYVNGVKSDEVKELYEACVHVNHKKYDVIEALECFRTVEIRKNITHFSVNGEEAEDYIYSLREDDEGAWLFIASKEHKQNYDVCGSEKLSIKIKGEYKACLYDSIVGKTEGLKVRSENGYTCIEKEVYPLDSLLIRLGCECAAEENKMPAESVKLREFDYSLSEPNVLLLDRAEFSFDGEEFLPSENLFKINDMICDRLGWQRQRGRNIQPWAEKNKEKHRVTLKYEIYSTIEVEKPTLALEYAKDTKIILNGENIQSTVSGYYVDRAIEKVTLPKLKKGKNELMLTMPFTRIINPEPCFILGDFGVSVRGSYVEISEKTDKLYFSSVTNQGLPFYGGNVKYRFCVETEECLAAVRLSFYRGAAVKLTVDGSNMGIITFPPYRSEKIKLSAGKHIIEAELLGTRENTFAPLHKVDNPGGWYAHVHYRTEGDNWCDEYILRDFGVMKAPELEIYK